MKRLRYHQLADAGVRPLAIGDDFGRSFYGTEGDDMLIGTALIDSFDVSQGGSDSVDGGPDKDFIQIGDTFDPTDRINGGDDLDKLILSGHYPSLTITETMLVNVEYLDLKFSADSIVRISAEAGSRQFAEIHTLSAPGTTSTIDARPTSVDVIVYSETPGDVWFLGGGGDDQFQVTRSASGAQFFDGGAGSDTISFLDRRDPITINLRRASEQVVGDISTTVRNVENVSGTGGSDTIIGTDAANWIGSNGGSDHILTYGGDDIVLVGRSYIGTVSVTGRVDGGEGTDLLVFYYNTAGPVRVSLANGAAQDTGQGIYKLTGFEDVIGINFGDTLTGNRNANRLFGAGGNDILSGGNGDDVLSGDGYLVSKLGEPAVFNYHTGPFAAKPDRNVLDGGNGDDTLYAGNGGDRMIGGFGMDILHGAAGADQFVFSSIRESRTLFPDTITGWTRGDLIDLAAIDADTAADGDQAFHFGATAARAGDIVATYDATANVTRVDLFVDGDARSDMTILLAGNISLAALDFVL